VRVKVLSSVATGWLVLTAFVSTLLGCALGAGAVLFWKH